MKGYRYCPNEGVQTHQFKGRDTEQAFRRLGKWLDQQPDHGRIVGIRICDDEGTDVFMSPSGRSDTPSPIYVILDWLR